MGTRPERGESVNAMTNMGEHVLMVNFCIYCTVTTVKPTS